jgi:hypothetical protein
VLFGDPDVAVPTTQEADLLVSIRKWLREPVRWQRVKCKPTRYRFDVSVLCFEAKADLRLIGNYVQRGWGFTLLLDDAYVIRRLDKELFAEHRNPDGRKLPGEHKHRWTEEFAAQEAYLPADIDFGDVNAAFQGFLAECNISLQSIYQPLFLP